MNSYSCHLSQFSNYLTENGNIFKDFKSVVTRPDKFSLDPISIFSIVSKNFILSNRTILNEVTKSEWCPSYDISASGVPAHSNIVLGLDQISDTFIDNCLDEIRSYLSGASTIGILLSGGMDSRIVAAFVALLQARGEFSGDVVALTWGNSDSRDVVYAERIANLFGWAFAHHKLSAETLYNNINTMADLGAETSPIHLHAMEQISNLNGIDLILAGSYGDSVGRGEYSGRKVGNLPGFFENDQNVFGLIRPRLETKLKQQSELILAKERLRVGCQREEQDWREIEMQMHYMHKQLNSCMALINNKIPVKQCFTHPNVYGFIWSLDKSLRTDCLYTEVLKKVSPRLLEIPWARNGKLYNSNSVVLDSFSSTHNEYGRWLRHDLRDYVRELITDGAIFNLGVFNEQVLLSLVKNWSSSTSRKSDRLDEKFAWLASLSLCVKKYDVRPVGNEWLCEDNYLNNLALSFVKVLYYKAYRAGLAFK